MEWNRKQHNRKETRNRNNVEKDNYLDYAGHAEVSRGEAKLECVLGAALLAEHDVVLVQQDVSSLLSIPKIEVVLQRMQRGQR
jgi:hypothetical protein